MSGWAEDLEGAGKILRDGVEIGEVFYTIRVYLARLLLVAFPLTDRAVPAQEPGPPVRSAWYLVPLFVLSFLVITLLLVMTPIEKQA